MITLLVQPHHIPHQITIYHEVYDNINLPIIGNQILPKPPTLLPNPRMDTNLLFMIGKSTSSLATKYWILQHELTVP